MREELPLTCGLAGDEQERRREDAGGLFGTGRLVGELEDGYEFAFRSDGTGRFVSEAFLASSS
jgi:hypothetical protein